MGHPVCCDRSRLDAIEGDEEEMDGERHPEGEQDVGDVEARVEVGADAGGHGEGGVEASAVGVAGGRDVREEADAKRVDGEQQGEDGEGEREAGGPVVDAEEMHGAGRHPVHEGRLVEEADAVDVGRDEVVAVEHLAGDLDVDGVDVVEQAGGEEAADLEDEPREHEDGDGAEAPAAGWCGELDGCPCSLVLLGMGLVSHEQAGCELFGPCPRIGTWVHPGLWLGQG